MATTLYFTSTVPDWSRGQGDVDLEGTTRNWTPQKLSTTRGGGATTQTRASATGPFSFGLEAGTNVEWISDPLDQDITISGSMTINLWGTESAMAANAAIGYYCQRLDSTGAVISIINNGVITTELGTASAVRTRSDSATSTNMLKGDRLRVRVIFIDGGGTMASGSTLTFTYNGTTAAADGDSYITFTEDFGFLTTLGTAVITQNTGSLSIALQGGTGTQEKFAQDFTLASTTNMSAASLSMFKDASPTDNLVLDVVSTLDGSSLASATVAASSVPAFPGAFMVFQFAAPVSLAAGSYYLQLSRSGARDTTNMIEWEYVTGDPYAGGTKQRRNSAVWTSDATNDFKFIIYERSVGSTLYLTDTASAVDPNGASYDAKEAWTSRGSAAVIIPTDPVVGPTARLLATVTDAGNFIEWFTKPLTAFTLSGLVGCNIRAFYGNSVMNAAVGCEIAVCATDGTSPVVWGAALDGIELTTTQAAMSFNIAGDDTAITDGQRLRIRVFFDDAPGVAMALSGGFNLSLAYAGTSAAASGDTYITLPQTVTEFSSAAATSLLYDSSPYQHILVQ